MKLKGLSNNKSIALIIGLFVVVVILATVGILSITGEEGPAKIDDEDVTQILDDGTCTAENAESLKVRAEKTEGFEATGLAYEQLVNCYIQISEYGKGAEAAAIAEENYTEAGLIDQAQQMGRSATLLKSIEEGEPEYQQDETREEDDGNAV